MWTVWPGASQGAGATALRLIAPCSSMQSRGAELASSHSLHGSSSGRNGNNNNIAQRSAQNSTAQRTASYSSMHSTAHRTAQHNTPHRTAACTAQHSATHRIVQQRAQRVDERRKRGAAACSCGCREELLKQLALLGAGLQFVVGVGRVRWYKAHSWRTYLHAADQMQ